MRIIEPGHVYELAFLDSDGTNRVSKLLTFVNREPGHEHPGTQVQEVLRALIDRTYHCDSCMPHELNALIIHHLRMALVFHEARALERKAEKGYYAPELQAVGSDGHFVLTGEVAVDPLAAPRREFAIKPDAKASKHREY